MPTQRPPTRIGFHAVDTVTGVHCVVTHISGRGVTVRRDNPRIAEPLRVYSWREWFDRCRVTETEWPTVVGGR